MSIDRLPDEILLMIFRRIDDFREKLELELVCRRWRKIMRNHGWKHLGQIVNRQNYHGLTPHKWAVPIGERCGNRLVECILDTVDIDSNLMRLIAGNLRALRHLTFYSCDFETLDVNVLDPFPEFGAHLRSLTLFEMDHYPQLVYNLLRHFPRLLHLGLYFYFHTEYDNDIDRYFSANLRSLYLNCFDDDSPDLEPMLAKMQTAFPGLVALYLDINSVNESVQLRISELKNLRFLNMGIVDNPDLVSSCLANMPHLRALQIGLSIEIMHSFPIFNHFFHFRSKFQHLSDLFRSPSFRGLVHLRLSLFAQPYDNFEPIGLLTTFAPHLRSLSLVIHAPYSVKLDKYHGIESQLLKIANSGKLEHLNVPCASFSTAEMDQLVRLCPNLHSFYARTSSPLVPDCELRSVVADQWHDGSRKHLPLRIWIHGVQHGHAATICQDPFLAVRHVNPRFVQPNPVLATFFREEVFNGIDDGGTPSFVTEIYDGQSGPRVAINDLEIF